VEAAVREEVSVEPAPYENLAAPRARELIHANDRQRTRKKAAAAEDEPDNPTDRVVAEEGVRHRADCSHSGENEKGEPPLSSEAAIVIPNGFGVGAGVHQPKYSGWDVRGGGLYGRRPLGAGMPAAHPLIRQGHG